MRTLMLVLVTLVVAGGCSLLGPGQDATLSVSVPVCCYEEQWPIGDTTSVTVNTSLDDPRGLAGLEITIGGQIPTRVFTAADFVDHAEPRFTVPDGGVATVFARLIQDGRIVAEGSESWPLEPEVVWRLNVTRAPYPVNEGLNGVDLENPRCQWFWCFRNWRFPIAEEFANYEQEALWVTLYRVHPDECLDVCNP